MEEMDSGFRRLNAYKKTRDGLGHGDGAPSDVFFDFCTNIFSQSSYFQGFRCGEILLGMSFWVITKSSFFKMTCWSSPEPFVGPRLQIRPLKGG